jgi:hypothetical protein
VQHGAGSAAAALEAAAGALTEALQPCDSIHAEATRAARLALEVATPLSVAEHAEVAEAAAARKEAEVAAKAAEVRLPTSLHTPQPGCAWDVGTAAS